VWGSGTWGKGATKATIRDDGHLVLTKADGTVVWDSTDAKAKNTLLPGQRMRLGDQIWSANGQHRLKLQDDGNLVVYSTTGTSWAAAGTYKHPNDNFYFQTDGNAVAYDASGKVLFATGTRNTRAVTLTLQNDGGLVMRNTSGQVVWTNRTDTLYQGERLETNGKITSLNGQYYFKLQTDGNCVLYGPGGSVLYTTKTWGKGLPYLKFQDDSNVVIYDESGAIWAAGTRGTDGNRFIITDQGKLVVKTLDDRVVWTANP